MVAMIIVVCFRVLNFPFADCYVTYLSKFKLPENADAMHGTWICLPGSRTPFNKALPSSVLTVCVLLSSSRDVIKPRRDGSTIRRRDGWRKLPISRRHGVGTAVEAEQCSLEETAHHPI